MPVSPQSGKETVGIILAMLSALLEHMHPQCSRMPIHNLQSDSLPQLLMK
jgi:hypothetical protein